MNYKIIGIKNRVIGYSEKTDPESLKPFYDKVNQSGYYGKMKNEFFELLDSQGDKTGRLKLRGAIHKDGDWHGAFHLHIFSREGNETFLLLQKRGHEKDVCPDKLDTVAAGHYAVGESLEDGVREVKEEIGLELKFDERRVLGKRINYDPQPEKGIFNCEFQDVALYMCDQPLEAYTLQESELAGILKVEIKDFIDLMLKRKESIDSVEARLFDQGILSDKLISIKRDDVWPTFDNYYAKVALLVWKLVNKREIPKNPFNLDITAFLV